MTETRSSKVILFFLRILQWHNTFKSRYSGWQWFSTRGFSILSGMCVGNLRGERAAQCIWFALHSQARNMLLPNSSSCKFLFPADDPLGLFRTSVNVSWGSSKNDFTARAEGSWGCIPFPTSPYFKIVWVAIKTTWWHPSEEHQGQSAVQVSSSW